MEGSETYWIAVKKSKRLVKFAVSNLLLIRYESDVTEERTSGESARAE